MSLHVLQDTLRGSLGSWFKICRIFTVEPRLSGPRHLDYPDVLNRAKCINVQRGDRWSFGGVATVEFSEKVSTSVIRTISLIWYTTMAKEVRMIEVPLYSDTNVLVKVDVHTLVVHICTCTFTCTCMLQGPCIISWLKTCASSFRGNLICFTVII